VRFSVSPVNDAPTANPVTALANENQAINVRHAPTDVDGDAEVSSCYISSPPALGQLYHYGAAQIAINTTSALLAVVTDASFRVGK
jgi:hypothetical protein